MNLKYVGPTFFFQDYANAIPFNLFLVCKSMHLFVCLFCFAFFISLIVMIMEKFQLPKVTAIY